MLSGQLISPPTVLSGSGASVRKAIPRIASPSSSCHQTPTSPGSGLTPPSASAASTPLSVTVKLSVGGGNSGVAGASATGSGGICHHHPRKSRGSPPGPGDAAAGSGLVGVRKRSPGGTPLSSSSSAVRTSNLGGVSTAGNGNISSSSGGGGGASSSSGGKPHRQNFTPTQNRILTEWYQVHSHRPYPSTDDTKFLAKQAGLFYSQSSCVIGTASSDEGACFRHCASRPQADWWTAECAHVHALVRPGPFRSGPSRSAILLSVCAWSCVSTPGRSGLVCQCELTPNALGPRALPVHAATGPGRWAERASTTAPHTLAPPRRPALGTEPGHSWPTDPDGQAAETHSAAARTDSERARAHTHTHTHTHTCTHTHTRWRQAQVQVSTQIRHVLGQMIVDSLALNGIPARSALPSAAHTHSFPIFNVHSALEVETSSLTLLPRQTEPASVDFACVFMLRRGQKQRHRAWISWRLKAKGIDTQPQCSPNQESTVSPILILPSLAGPLPLGVIVYNTVTRFSQMLRLVGRAKER
ncbi:unnamed protein product [Protopolystoma xenopodis]|uniref:Homeobox KN domain-containing protein n=1 Tax=Protopolystoma xenopodis TaxID=117903 RepID=A0A448WMP2_9PLAT|nr:unnamed protein product [Protopolystoma xenopodis]